MEESMTVQLRELREEQHRLEQLLGHTALGTSSEASAMLHGTSSVSGQQRCVRELSAHEVNTSAQLASTATANVNDDSAAKANCARGTDGGAVVGGPSAPQRAQWSYQERLQELEALKKKYEHYARTSMSQYLNSVSDFEGYKERRASRMKHVQPFTFESRELVKPPRIREQRTEADRHARETALEERRRHPLKAKPVPPSTFMNKYELMVEEWCQRKAAIELMSRERARLAKEEAEYVRLSAQSLRKTREELMGVVYGPDGKVVTRSEQRRRAQSAEARGGGGGAAAGTHPPHHHSPSEVPLEVKMKLWPALSDHERVRKERILYRAALRKVEVDEEVRQVLPLLTSATPARCYDAATNVNAALLLGVTTAAPGTGGPCFGVGQAIHPTNAVNPVAAAASGNGVVASAPAVAASLAASAPVSAAPVPTVAVSAAPAPLAASVPLPPPSGIPAAPPSTVPPPPSAVIPVPPPPAATPAVPAAPVPPPPGVVVVPASPAPHQSLSLLSTSTVSTPPLGVGGATGGSPVPTPAGAAAVGGPTVSSGSSPSPLLSIVPSAVVSPASPQPPLPPPPAAAVPPPPPPTSSATTAPPASTATAPPASPVPPPPLSTVVPPVPPPSASVNTAPATTVPAAAMPPPPPPAIATAAPAAASANAGAPGAALAPAVATANTTTTVAAVGPASAQEEKEALWRRYNPQLTFKPNVKPGVPDFAALWAKNKVELAEKKKAQPTTTARPFDLTPSAKAEKVVGRRPTRSVTALAPPARHRSASRGKQPAAAAPAAAGAPSAPSSPPPPTLDDTRPPQKSGSTAPRGTRAHALRTEAIYACYVQQSEEHNKVAEADAAYWRAVSQRQREVRQRLAGYISDHHLEHERTIQSKVRALRASMKESEAAAEARLAEMKQRVAEMPPVFAEPVHLHEESKARAEVEQSILQSLKDTGLDGATIKNILATSASNAENADAGNTVDDAVAPEPAKPADESVADAPHSPPTSANAKGSAKGSNENPSKSDSSSTIDSDSDSDSSGDSGSSDSSSTRSSGGAGKKSSSVAPRRASLSVPSVGSVPVPKPVTPKNETEYSDDSFEDSSDSD